MAKTTDFFNLFDDVESELVHLTLVKDLLTETFKDFESDFDLNDETDRREGDFLLKFRVPKIRSFLYIAEEYIDKINATLTRVVEQSSQLKY